MIILLNNYNFRVVIFDPRNEDQCFVTFDSDSLTIPSQLDLPFFPPQPYHIYYAPNSSNGKLQVYIIHL